MPHLGRLTPRKETTYYCTGGWVGLRLSRDGSYSFGAGGGEMLGGFLEFEYRKSVVTLND